MTNSIVNDTDILLESGTNELELIEFFVDEIVDGEVHRNYYGVNVAKVLEVVEAPPGLEPVESAKHESFLGTIPLRDVILPIIDLAIWLGVERAENEHESIIVTEFNNVVTGFRVSGVTQIHRLNWGDIVPPNKVFSTLPSNCMNGTVQINDHFTLVLDLERALEEFNADYARHVDDIEAHFEEQYHVLLVDDSTSVILFLKNVFEKANFITTLAKNGEEGWERLVQFKKDDAAGETDPEKIIDVVVADVEMPVMDGYTLTRKIKEDDELKKLPVVLFSSLISDSSFHKGEAVMADAQVTKPEFVELADRVAILIEEKKKELT